MSRVLRSSEAGFSLTEVIVAMFIAGLTMSFVLISLPSGTEPLEKAENTLLRQIELMRDLSRTTGQPYGLDLDADKSTAIRLVGGEWVPADTLGDASVFQIELPVRMRRGTQSERQVNSPSRLMNAETQRLQPDIWFDPSGIATAEIITLNHGQKRIEIQVDREGQIRVARFEP